MHVLPVARSRADVKKKGRRRGIEDRCAARVSVKEYITGSKHGKIAENSWMKGTIGSVDFYLGEIIPSGSFSESLDALAVVRYR